MNTPYTPPLSSSKKSGELDITSAIVSLQDTLESGLMKEFDRHIAGQSEAKEAIIRTILTGIHAIKKDGALGAVFLGGPTGVGKSQLAKTLAYILFGDAGGFVRIPGERLKHAADVASLDGSVPGYVGYGDTPKLSDIRLYSAYRRAKEQNTLHPLLHENYGTIDFSIVLIEEAEKAHPEVMDAFLGALTDGEIEMNSGKEGSVNSVAKHSRFTDLHNTLFIFTSNIGEQDISTSKNHSIGFQNVSATDQGDFALFEKELKNSFRPEFLGRMNHIVRCHHLTTDMARQIMNISVQKINIALSPYYDGNLSMEMTSALQDQVMDTNREEIRQKGGRPIIRMMDTISERVGLAIHKPRDVFGKGFTGGRMVFDLSEGKPSIHLIALKRRTEALSLIQPEERANTIDTLIEGRLNDARKMVDTYKGLLRNYDTNFYDALTDLERRMEKNLGFTNEDISQIRTAYFLDFHAGVESPSSPDEVITEDIGTFEDIEIKALRRIIIGLVKQGTNLGTIYIYIYGFIARPLTQSELRYLSYYIQQLEMKRHAKIR